MDAEMLGCLEQQDNHPSLKSQSLALGNDGLHELEFNTLDQSVSQAQG